MNYLSTAKPYYRFELDTLCRDIKIVGWNDKKLVIDAKVDGLRVSFGKNNKGFVYVDPAELKKKSPDVSNRLIKIVEEIEQHIPNDSTFDGELFAMQNKEVLHRTVANSLLNAVKEITPEQVSRYAHIFSFTPLILEGKDVRGHPLKERLELLNKIEDTEHIIFERPSTSLKSNKLAYMVDGNDCKSIEKATNYILNNEEYKYLAEGVVVKRLDATYPK